eukprot:CAMPEP_0197517602 /NCGR_PEP_ID=MMETSP1318-20131121/2637_1 /TAXON_ID=552666 /ORGANISM="Partenskyella glossopodia, Strain RCC365" /LENGTH=109 /DNA_ID=CAMNT_0043067293 /DNA_START=591 /DNA_END=920 /DNA_ORIENTATION=-
MLYAVLLVPCCPCLVKVLYDIHKDEKKVKKELEKEQKEIEARYLDSGTITTQSEPMATIAEAVEEKNSKNDNETTKKNKNNNNNNDNDNDNNNKVELKPKPKPKQKQKP